MKADPRMKTRHLQRAGELVSRFRRDEQGAVAIMVALLMTALLGFTGLVVDVGDLYVQRTQLQAAADAAAMAGAQDLSVSSTCSPASGSTCATDAQNYGVANGLATSEIIYNDHPATDPVPSTIPASSAWQVTAKRTVNLFFMPVLGINQKDVEATSTAIRSPIAGAVNPAPYLIWAGNVAKNFSCSPPPGCTFTDWSSSNPKWVYQPFCGGTCGLYVGAVVTIMDNRWCDDVVYPATNKCTTASNPPFNTGWNVVNNNYHGYLDKLIPAPPNTTINNGPNYSAGGTGNQSAWNTALCNAAQPGATPLLFPEVDNITYAASGLPGWPKGMSYQINVVNWAMANPLFNDVIGTNGNCNPGNTVHAKITSDNPYTGVVGGGPSQGASTVYVLQSWN